MRRPQEIGNRKRRRHAGMRRGKAFDARRDCVRMRVISKRLRGAKCADMPAHAMRKGFDAWRRCMRCVSPPRNWEPQKVRYTEAYHGKDFRCPAELHANARHSQEIERRKMRGHAGTCREKGFRCAEGTTYERMPSCKRGSEAQATGNEKFPGTQAVECH